MEMFKKEFMTSVTLTERVYMHGENQRIDRTLTDNEGHVICHEDYPALSDGGKLGALAQQIAKLSTPVVMVKHAAYPKHQARPSIIQKWIKKLLTPIVQEVLNQQMNSREIETLEKLAENLFPPQSLE